MEHYWTNNKELKSELRDINVSLDEYDFVFKSDNGVFSKNRIDFASLFLVKTFLSSSKNNIQSILDVGCGYGFIGIVLSKILKVHVDMVDINKRALHLCKMNVDINKVDCEVKESNIYSSIDKKYDLIITNPPIRVGKEVLKEFLLGGLKYLNKDGELWFVISKDQGAKSAIKELEKVCFCQIIDKSKGFWVISAKN